MCTCAGPEPSAPAAVLENGVYEVLATGAHPSDLRPGGADTRVLILDRQFIAGGDEVPPEHVLLRVRG